MFINIKSLLPDRPVPLRIWRGPFRGARVVMNPQCSMRKMAGLYEHELNPWLELALRRVSHVIDVGANDGYFTFGCAAALRRLNVDYRITSFEPQARHVELLRQSVRADEELNDRCQIIHAAVGREMGSGVTTLDALLTGERRTTLIKIDVEGAEIDVIAGATSWLDPTNLFLIEVHDAEFLTTLRQIFGERGLGLEQVDQRPLRLFGRDTRDAANWWLVSPLG